MLAIYGGVIYYFSHSLLAVLVFVGLMFALILVMNYGVVYYRVKKEFLQHKLIQQGYTFEFDAQGCRLETISGFAKYDWQDLLKWASNSKFIIIYPAPRMFHIIPKRLNSDEFDIQLLESYLMKQVKKAG
jgi:ABC-type bacteriocin/lantibiotic exporter with double-glycine peptidase domain